MFDDPRGPGQPRWGTRALLCLAVAWVSLVLANAFSNNAALVLLSLVGTVAGFADAAVCSVLGVRAWFGVGRRPR